MFPSSHKEGLTKNKSIFTLLLSQDAVNPFVFPFLHSTVPPLSSLGPCVDWTPCCSHALPSPIFISRCNDHHHPPQSPQQWARYSLSMEAWQGALFSAPNTTCFQLCRVLHSCFPQSSHRCKDAEPLMNYLGLLYSHAALCTPPHLSLICQFIHH